MPNEQVSGIESLLFHLCLTTLFFKGLEHDVLVLSVSLLNSLHKLHAQSTYFVSSYGHCPMHGDGS